MKYFAGVEKAKSQTGIHWCKHKQIWYCFTFAWQCQRKELGCFGICYLFRYNPCLVKALDKLSLFSHLFWRDCVVVTQERWYLGLLTVKLVTIQRFSPLCQCSLTSSSRYEGCKKYLIKLVLDLFLKRGKNFFDRYYSFIFG